MNIVSLGLDAGSTPTKRCVIGGPLSPCDVTSSTSDVSVSNPFVGHLLHGDTIEVTVRTIQHKMEGADATIQTQHTQCNVFQLMQVHGGKIHMTVDSTCTINSVSLSGQLETGTGAKVTITGTQSVIPGGTYGTQC